MTRLTARLLRNRVLTILDRHEDMQDFVITHEDNLTAWLPAIKVTQGDKEFLLTFEEQKSDE